MKVRQISVPLSQDEYLVLERIANDECRRPRDQLRFIVRSFLTQKSEDTGLTLASNPVSSDPSHAA
jgi:hypothetical protein